MKKAFGTKPFKSFRDKYLALAVTVTAILISLTGLAQSTGNDTTKYTKYKRYGDRFDRVQADTVLSIPKDTIFSKSGLAKIDNKLYIGNGLFWTTATNNYVNAKDFGAKGNNVSNEKAAIEKAVDYAYAHNIGYVYLPGGDYILGSSVNLKSGITIFGDGYNTHIKQGTGFSISAPMNFGLFNIYNQKNIKIQNIRFEGKWVANPPTYPTDVNTWAKLIYWQDSDSIEIRNCYFENSNYEAIWQGGQGRNCKGAIIVNNFFTNIGTPNSFIGLPALQLNVTGAIVDANVITRCGIGIGSTGPNHIVENNRILFPTYYGIQVGDIPVKEDSPQEGIYANNSIYIDNEYYGIVFDQNFNTHNTISGNTVVVSSNSDNAEAYKLTGAGSLDFNGNSAIILNKGKGVNILGSIDSNFSFNVNSNNNKIIKRTRAAGFGWVASTASNTRKLTLTQSNDVVLCDTPSNATFADFSYTGVGSKNNKVHLNNIISTGALGINGPDGNSYSLLAEPQRMGRPGSPISLSNQDAGQTIVTASLGKLIFDRAEGLSILRDTLKLVDQSSTNRHRTSIAVLPEVTYTPDSIKNITGTNQEGYLLIISGSTLYGPTMNISILNGGNIKLGDGTNFVINSSDDRITLIFDGTYWNEISRSGSGTAPNTDAFSASTNITRTIAAGKLIEYIIVTPDDDIEDFHIGTEIGGRDFYPSYFCAAGSRSVIPPPANGFFESTTLLYFSGITSTTEIKIIYKKLKE